MSGACYLCKKPNDEGEFGGCDYQHLAFTDRGKCPEMKWAIYGLIHQAAEDVKFNWQKMDKENESMET